VIEAVKVTPTGGGFGIALACDIRSLESAAFCTQFIKSASAAATSGVSLNAAAHRRAGPAFDGS